MLDLCSGLGGASAAMRERGWDVVTVDVDRKLRADVVADVRGWSYCGPPPDLVWASPPCAEFSREHMPWLRTGREPDLSIVLGCKRIMEESKTRFWIFENVKGAQVWLEPYLGRVRAVVGPYYLWGFFPELGYIDWRRWRGKMGFSGGYKARRALIPYDLSLAVCVAVEMSGVLL